MNMFVLDNPDLLVKVMEAWMEAGVRYHVLDSTGVQRLREQGGLQTFLGFRCMSLYRVRTCETVLGLELVHVPKLRDRS